MKYFAYGSNMLAARLRRRGVSAQAVGPALLRGHRLVWTKRSADGSGKCGVLPTADPADVVWGVLFEIDDRELSILDRAEGAGRGYLRETIAVRAGGRPVEAATYIAIDVVEGLRPYEWYKRLAVAGAKKAGLPTAYIDWLNTVSSKQDPDEARRDAELRTLAPEGD
jgi:gamma-glutamylcyclotransferase